MRGAAAAVRRTRAGNQVLVGYVVPARRTELRRRRRGPAAARPAAGRAGPADRGGRRAAHPDLGQGRPGRAALAAARDRRRSRPVAAGRLTPTEAWLAAGWAEILGVAVADPNADFFTHGGGSLTAAQLVALIRTRHPQVSVSDLYQRPTARPAGRPGWTRSTRDRPARARSPRPRAGPRSAQALLLAPMLALVGLRWTTVAAALSTVAALAGAAWAPAVPWWSLALAWLLLFSPAGRIAIAAGGARLLLRGVRRGSYPRGGSVHLRLWAATRLAELSGATSVAGRVLDGPLRPRARRQRSATTSTCTPPRR